MKIRNKLFYTKEKGNVEEVGKGKKDQGKDRYNMGPKVCGRPNTAAYSDILDNVPT